MWRGRALVVGMLFLAGCSGASSHLPATYPVVGQVVDSGGRPLTGGTVEFETKRAVDLTVLGVIQPDGTFVVKTFRDEAEVSGAPEGDYRITITLPPGPDNAASLPVTLARPYRVEPKENSFPLRLAE